MRKLRYPTVLIITLVIPLFLLSVLRHPEEIQNSQQNIPVKSKNADELSLKIMDDGIITQIPLEAYVSGVLYGEMPNDFEMEALKAQAVATRTYTLRRLSGGGKHENADLCTDSSCCQAYRDADASEAYQKCSQATEATKGEVLLYDGELIEATYFSCSGGKTEDAVEVWGADIPYLRSVDSPGEENAAHYQDTYFMDLVDFSSRLGISEPDDVTIVSYTNGGGVKTIKIGDKEFSGIQVRKALDLRSTAFAISILDGGVVIRTKGYGHRVGMSQYGAQAMALSGSDYTQILSYYYPDTQQMSLDSEQVQTLFDKDAFI